MQPEPSTIPPKPSTETTATQQNDTRQDGCRADDATLSPPPAASAVGAGRSKLEDEQSALDAALAASLQDAHEARTRSDGRLSARSTPSPPGRNRISEYEKASTPPVRRGKGPAFEVIKKPRSPNDKRSPIQELPNGLYIYCARYRSPC